MKACASNPSNQFGVKGLKNKKGQNNRMERRKANHSERTMKKLRHRKMAMDCCGCKRVMEYCGCKRVMEYCANYRAAVGLFVGQGCERSELPCLERGDKKLGRRPWSFFKFVVIVAVLGG